MAGVALNSLGNTQLERVLISLQSTLVFPSMEAELFNQSNLPPTSVSSEKMYFCSLCPWHFVLYFNGLDKDFLTHWWGWRMADFWENEASLCFSKVLFPSMFLLSIRKLRNRVNEKYSDQLLTKVKGEGKQDTHVLFVSLILAFYTSILNISPMNDIGGSWQAPIKNQSSVYHLFFLVACDLVL